MEHTQTPHELVVFNRTELVALMDLGLVTADTHHPLARVARFFYTRVLTTDAPATLSVGDIWRAYQDFDRTHPCKTPPDFTAGLFAYQFNRLVIAYGNALQPTYESSSSAKSYPTITAVTGPITLMPFDAPEAYVDGRIARAHAHLSERLAARRAASSTANVAPSAVAPGVSQIAAHLADIVGPKPCVIAGVNDTSRRRVRDMDRDS
ncbi:MAG: hypothetical protein H6922_06055 [Pseudomonadaceae bacterium]|nr:hypothetical protein [Pseudomonadaceae bacterium]